MKILASMFASGACVAALDLFWVGWAANAFYKSRLGHLMAERVYWPGAIGFYLIYPAAVWFFAVSPAASAGAAAARGAALGFTVYGVYNFTNLALLKGWTWQVVLADVAWGTLLTAAAALAGFAASAGGTIK
ncbi:MAG: DUF2177 family protein [Elusimicrobiota bacterium]|jgi:uncharacterized membrane protein